MTAATSPGGVGGAASAVTMASIGSGSATLVDITAGQTVSNARLTPGDGAIVGVGAISAGYGGSGESLTYSAEADFSFATTAPEYLTLLDSNASGNGFDALKFQVTVDGTIEVLDTFTSLSVAEAFFSGHTIDLGAWSAANQTVDLSYWLTASAPGAGFGFTYAFAGPAVATPEPSTWAMMLIGFAGLGFAAHARRGARRPAAPRPARMA